MKNIIKEIGSTLIYILIVLAGTWLLVTFVGQRTEVSGGSMEPSLYSGDNLIVDKISYRLGDPERYDIIVFPFRYEEHVYYIKRIIGMPGETVWIDEDGTIYVGEGDDLKQLKEHYGKEVIQNPGMASEPIVLGEDEYFVLGDNRNNSSDSRDPSVGKIHRNEIIGKAWVRIFPFDRFGLLKHQ